MGEQTCLVMFTCQQVLSLTPSPLWGETGRRFVWFESFCPSKEAEIKTEPTKADAW